MEISRRKLLAAGAAAAAAETACASRSSYDEAVAHARANWRAQDIQAVFSRVRVAPDFNAKAMYEAFIGPDGNPTHGAACVTYPGNADRRKAFVVIDVQDFNSIDLMKSLKRMSSLIDFHIFPIAFIGPVSEYQGATIIGAPNPVLALDDQLALFSQKESNGIEYDVSRITEDSEKKLWANTNLFRATRGVDVPFGIYLGMDGAYRPFNNDAGYDELLSLFDLEKVKK